MRDIEAKVKKIVEFHKLLEQIDAELSIKTDDQLRAENEQLRRDLESEKNTTRELTKRLKQVVNFGGEGDDTTTP